MRIQGYSYPRTFREKQIDAIVSGRKDISGINDEATLRGVPAVIVQNYPDRQKIASGYALIFRTSWQAVILVNC